jgi:predicted nucleic acid-binding protein
MVVVDTNLIIDHLRLKGKRDSLLVRLLSDVGDDNVSISVVTIQELFAGQSTLRHDESTQVERIIDSMRILPYTHQIARLAGTISRDQPGKVSFMDAAIAATVMANDASLATLNRKDFVGIKKLKLMEM